MSIEVQAWRRAVALLLALGAVAAAPGGAAAQSCPEANPSYTDACGPTFTTPPWGDAGGWTDPSKYSTIQLADLNGDGKDELLARNDQGLEIWWFDTNVGQWRPQTDANGVPQVLTDFASPAPGTAPATDWTQPQYYSTIHAVDVDGQPGAEIVARFADGIRVYQYSPPAGGNAVSGGGWQRIGTRGPFSDADGYADPSLYRTIQVARFTSRGKPALFARVASKAGDPTIAFYAWTQGSWSKQPVQNAVGGFIGAFSDAACAQPFCYLNLSTANVAVGDPHGLPFDTADVVGLVSQGVTAFDLGAGWNQIDGGDSRNPAATPGPFAAVNGADCPFTSSSPDCLGSSPSYYETLGAANVDGNPGDELVARASDGLRVKQWVAPIVQPGGQFQPLATLGALGGGAGSVSPGEWGSIRTGDINADGRDEVLALDGNGLEAWSYNPTANAWSELQPSTPLALTGDWLTHPEYFSTIRVGDVDGDGRADVVARGPFGIRTWFYNRRGTGGWERYLAGGYPAFPGTAATGQQAAFAALNALALSRGAITQGRIRDVWTGANPPNATTLATLQSSLAGSLVGNCSNETSLGPPTYASCVPPAASSGFTGSDWTAVVNELLSEAYSAEQVVDHFADVNTIRQGVFESESGALPAIASDLQLGGAAGNIADFNLQGFFAGATGIAASIAGLVPGAGAVASAGLWVASEVISMLPSASPTATSSFETTYSGLLGKLATAQDEMQDQLASQSQQVLSDQGLLSLVGQLRSRGTWTLDIDGMLSASREAFALQTYRTLMPTIYQRFAVTECTPSEQGSTSPNCVGLPTGPYVADSSATSATWLGPNAVFTVANGLSLCPPAAGVGINECDYTSTPGTVPDDVASILWGAISPTCNYKPGSPNSKNTLWHYGCSLGVPTAMIGADVPASGSDAGWTFTTLTGTPVINQGCTWCSVAGVVRARPARTGSRAAAARAGSSPRASRELLDPLRFTGRVSLSRELRLRRTRVVVERTLFDHIGGEELAKATRTRRLRPFALRHVRGGLFTAAARRGRPGVRLRLQRRGASERVRANLRLTGVRTRDIRALCGVLPARVSLAGRPLELETRLRLRDRAVTARITTRQRWRCVRDRKGEFAGLRPVAPRRPPARPGLAVHLQTPRVLSRGRAATVLITVANRRRPRPSRVVSSLWNLRITGTAGARSRTVELKQLRARRSRLRRLSVRVPRTARGRVCVQVTASADSARPASARRCAASPARRASPAEKPSRGAPPDPTARTISRMGFGQLGALRLS